MTVLTIDFGVGVMQNEGHVQQTHDLVINIHRNIFAEGVPLDEPECSFDGSACDNSTEIAIVITVIIVVISAIIARRYKLQRQYRQLRAMTWKINLDDFVVSVVPRENQSSKELRIMSKKSAFNVESTPERRRVSHNATVSSIDGQNLNNNDDDWPSMLCEIGNLHQTRCQSLTYTQHQQFEHFSDETLRAINSLKQVNSETLNSFLGIAFNQNNQFTIFWKYEAKCTLYEVIGNTDLSLSPEFQTSFLTDVVLGMHYLHTSAHLSHGQLDLHACIVTPQWTVKLSNYGLNNLMREAVDQKFISIKPQTLHEMLHVPPEHFIERNNRLYKSCFSGDIYALGIVAYEIFSMCFIQDAALIEINSVSDGNQNDNSEISGRAENLTMRHTMCWNFGKEKEALARLMKSCVHRKEAARPAIEQVKSIVFKNVNVALRKDGIVGHMVKMMETYAEDLEALVGVRTAELEETQKQADRLLNQLLPRSVAAELKLGKVVNPELFEAATIGFVDIVHFTDFCSQSSPFEIVNMLNDLFSQFDAVVTTYNAYKVETIGDAYMIVSGIPLRNGTKHAGDICAALCAMVTVSEQVRVEHMPEEYRIRLRGGVHTGPTAAGVVGIHAPRYCLFGDTVNVASRMESTGETGQVQVTDTTKEYLDKDKFKINYRGVVNVKGKGDTTTYWVEKL